MKKLIIIFLVIIFIVVIGVGVWYFVFNKPEQDNQNLPAGCKNFWWYDNEHSTCQQPKQFCGAYMYLGLQTFETKEECENSFVKTYRNETADWKIYRNEKYEFQLEYPAGWVINEYDFGFDISDGNKDKVCKIDGGSFGFGLEGWTFEEKDIVIDSQKYIQKLLKDENGTLRLISIGDIPIDPDGLLLRFYNQNCLDKLYQILSTFKFIP